MRHTKLRASAATEQVVDCLQPWAKNYERRGEESLSRGSIVPLINLTIGILAGIPFLESLGALRGAALRNPSVADDVAVVDGSANQRPCASADDRAERLRSTRSDDVAEHATADAADDQAGGAVVALAVVAVVRATVDAIVSAQPLRTVTVVVSPVIARRIPVTVTRVVAIFTAVPFILTPIPAIFATIPAIFLAIPPVLATIPTILVAIPAIPALGQKRRWLQADERCQEQYGACCSETVHLALPSDGYD